MSPTCSKAALRVLFSVLLASSVADAAALRHQVLDTRDTAAAQLENAQLAADAIQAAATVLAEDPSNIFDDISAGLQNRTAFQLVQEFFARLFGPREDADEPAATTTVYVTETLVPVATSSISLILPPGPSEVASSEVSSTTSIPADDIFSILPVGALTTAINATFLSPIFYTAPEETPAPTPSVIEIIAPFPLLNETTPSGVHPTAVPITGEFSATIPLITGVPASAPANYSSLSGTALALPWTYNETFPALNPTAVTAPILPSGIAAALNTTANITVVVVTETVIPVPVLVTGTAAAVVSAGTGLPIVIVASPIWANSSYGEATAVAPLIGTGTGSPIIGTGSPSTGGALPAISEVPTFPNTTTATVIVPIPILVTGVPDAININATIPATPTNDSSAAEAPGVTAIPIIVTGIPGSVLEIDVTIPLPVYPNTTASALPSTAVDALAASAFSSAPVSVGTSLPAISAVGTPLYVNTTTTTFSSLVIETATAILILPPAPLATDAAPGTFNVTLPLIVPTGGYGSA